MYLCYTGIVFPITSYVVDTGKAAITLRVTSSMVQLHGNLSCLFLHSQSLFKGFTPANSDTSTANSSLQSLALFVLPHSLGLSVWPGRMANVYTELMSSKQDELFDCLISVSVLEQSDLIIAATVRCVRLIWEEK